MYPCILLRMLDNRNRPGYQNANTGPIWDEKQVVIPSRRLVGLTRNEKARNETPWCLVSELSVGIQIRLELGRDTARDHGLIASLEVSNNAFITLSPRSCPFHQQRDRPHMDRQRKCGPCAHAEATLRLELRVVGHLADTKDRCGHEPRPFVLFTKTTFLTFLCEQ